MNHARVIAAGAGVVVCAVVLAGCTGSGGGSGSSSSPPRPTPPSSSSAPTPPSSGPSLPVPEGWQPVQGAGFSFAVPRSWQVETGQEVEPATVQAGPQYDGGPLAAPVLQVFVDPKGTGSVANRVGQTRASLELQLQGRSLRLGSPKDVSIDGADTAQVYSYTYDTPERESVTGRTLPAAQFTQHDLILEGDSGRAKVAIRFGAPTELKLDPTWKQIVDSVHVLPVPAGQESSS